MPQEMIRKMGELALSTKKSSISTGIEAI